MEKECPRCHKPFICKVDDISKCFCSAVVLPGDVYQFIKNNYSTCLCEKCLKELISERQRSPKPTAVHNQ
ncbi:MAG: cysteine-rich CWC family protein [Breznakibacter sp.]|nr:cysteine-rich CWC family protein [Breznakibacter sp.]